MGSVFIFSGSDGTILRRFDATKLRSNFGKSVAGGGDLNGDGTPDLVIGADNFEVGSMKQAGSVFAYSLKPTFTHSVSSISASRGGDVDFELDFPISEAQHNYKILISKRGVGVTHKGVDIPLASDTYLWNSASGIYPFPGSPNLHGTLDNSAHAFITLSFPPGLSSTLVGRHIWLAAVSMPAGRLPTFSSEAIPLLLFP